MDNVDKLEVSKNTLVKTKLVANTTPQVKSLTQKEKIRKGKKTKYFLSNYPCQNQDSKQIKTNSCHPCYLQKIKRCLHFKLIT